MDFFAEFMAARAPVLKLGSTQQGQQAEYDDGPLNLEDPSAIEARANAFMKQESEAGRTVSFEFAVQHVTTRAEA